MDMVNGKIKVYNYETSPIGFPSQTISNGVFLRGREEEDKYVVERVLWEDIEAENSKSDIFRIGRLRFEPSDEDEIYRKLGIDDKENIMNDAELIKLLKDKSIDNLIKLDKINSNILLGRIKSMLFKMEKNGDMPSHEVITVVTEKYNELKNGKRRGVENKFIDTILAKKNENREKNELLTTLEKMKNEIEKLKEEEDKKTNVKKNEKKAKDDETDEMLRELKKLKEENEKLKKNMGQESKVDSSTKKPVKKPVKKPAKKSVKKETINKTEKEDKQK